MNLNQIPKKYRDNISTLRFNSGTIEADVNQAIDDATDWNEAMDSIQSFMENLISEAQGVIETVTDQDDHTLIHALELITEETIDEVSENCGQTWYRVDNQWYFIMTAECEK